LNGGEEAIAGICDKGHEEVNPSGAGFSKVGVQEGMNLVNGHGVVNVHDNRWVGFRLGQGSEV